MTKTLSENSLWYSCALKHDLSFREIQVLELLIEGKNNKEIADELHITIHTVKVYVAQIIHKFGVRDRIQTVIKALSKNINDS